MEIVLSVEGRNKKLKLKGVTRIALEEAFQEMCHNDPVLKKRTSTHFPTFNSYSDEYKMDIEIEYGEVLKKGQLVKVFFAAYSAIVSKSNTFASVVRLAFRQSTSWLI